LRAPAFSRDSEPETPGPGFFPDLEPGIDYSSQLRPWVGAGGPAPSRAENSALRSRHSTHAPGRARPKPADTAPSSPARPQARSRLRACRASPAPRFETARPLEGTFARRAEASRKTTADQRPSEPRSAPPPREARLWPSGWSEHKLARARPDLPPSAICRPQT